MVWTGAWSAVTVMVADWPCCTVVVPVRRELRARSSDTIVVVAEPGGRRCSRGPVSSETISVLSGSTSVSWRVRIWIVVDVAFAGRVNGPPG